MPVLNRTADLQETLVAWRHDFHQNPELGNQETRTSRLVAERLEAMGIEVVRGIGGTGVVGVIQGRGADTGQAIGLRADMDALPITEATGLDYASQNPGVMHACGHDGHTTMLLGAAQILAETRNFSGKVYVIFQPAEEGGGGAEKMVKDGLFQRFPMQAVFGLHNEPGLPVGQMSLCQGATMASADTFTMTITGRGGHAALPHLANDPVVIAGQFIVAVQGLVSRSTDAQQSAVISICQFEAGHAANVIPREVHLGGTIRTLDADVRKQTVAAFERLAQGLTQGYGAQVAIEWTDSSCPVTFNDPRHHDVSVRAAEAVVGAERLNAAAAPMMASEDFAFMLDEVAGSYIFMGNGDGAGVHEPDYQFCDEAMPVGVSYFVKLTEEALPLTE